MFFFRPPKQVEKVIPYHSSPQPPPVPPRKRKQHPLWTTPDLSVIMSHTPPTGSGGGAGGGAGGATAGTSTSLNVDVPPLPAVIFDGSIPTVDFLRRFQARAKSHNWDDDAKVVHLSDHLVGAPSIWLGNYRAQQARVAGSGATEDTVTIAWADVIAAMKIAFPDKETYSLLESQAKKLKLADCKSVEQYYQTMLKILMENGSKYVKRKKNGLLNERIETGPY